MNIFEDGPYEVGGETDHDESLVPVPANSYLGRNECSWHARLARCLSATLSSQDPPWTARLRRGQAEPGACGCIEGNWI